MRLSIEEKVFIFEVFLKKYKLYDRYLAYQHRHHNRGIRGAVEDSPFTGLIMQTICWSDEVQEFKDLNHLDHYDDPNWCNYDDKWEEFATKLLNE